LVGLIKNDLKRVFVPIIRQKKRIYTLKVCPNVDALRRVGNYLIEEEISYLLP